MVNTYENEMITGKHYNLPTW